MLKSKRAPSLPDAAAPAISTALAQQQIKWNFQLKEPILRNISHYIGKKIHSLSSKSHTSLQPLELQRLGIPMTYDSMIAYGGDYIYEGK